MPDAAAPQVILTPLKPALITGVAQKLTVLVRVQAPDPLPGAVPARPPHRLALVIDRSGSMSGEPLREAKRCAAHIVDRLAATDRAALVTFDNRVHTLVAADPVGDRQALHRALAGIHEGGNTDLHGGWAAGAAALAGLARESGLSRVILLSDGNANEGVTGLADIVAACAQAAATGVTTSTYGLGRDFNENLMVAMGRAGQGNHYYGQTAQDLLEPFAEEFDLISSLHARQLRLFLGVPQGVRLSVRNPYPVEDRDGFPVVHLPDLAWGAEAWCLAELEVPGALALEAGNKLLQAGVTGATPSGEPVAFPEAVLELKGVPPGAWEVMLADPRVAGRAAELEAARLLEQARAAALAGDWEALDRMLARAAERFAGYPWVAQVLDGLAGIARMRDTQHFSKSAMYSGLSMGRRLAAKEEHASLVAESVKPSFLRRKREQGKSDTGRGKDPDA